MTAQRPIDLAREGLGLRHRWMGTDFPFIYQEYAHEHFPALARAYIEATQPLSDARSVIDTLMGDSDLPDDDSEEMRLMQRIPHALAALDGGSNKEETT